MCEIEQEDPGVEASEGHRLEQLGRERPKCFVTWYSELAFCFSVVMSQILAVSRLNMYNAVVYGNSGRIYGSLENIILMDILIRNTTYLASMFYCRR